MVRARTFIAALWALFVTTVAASAQAQMTKLSVIVFPGVQNLPIFAAQTHGFFAARGLDVEIKFTPNSVELRNGLAEGRYQIAHSAVDNAFALKDKADVDTAVVMGGDDGFNKLIVQPEITSLADIKGKTVVVDAVDTAFAFQLYEILRQNGVERGDYQINPAGGATLRLEAMIKSKAMVAAMMNLPFTIRAEQAGLKSMGTATSILGAYQGTSAFVLRSWGQANTDTIIKYLQGYIEGLRWTLNTKNKPEAVSLLVERIKVPAEIAAQAYDIAADPRNGFAKDAALNMDGIRNVLRLRAQFEGGKPTPPEKYLDLSYYQRAVAGL